MKKLNLCYVLTLALGIAAPIEAGQITTSPSCDAHNNIIVGTGGNVIFTVTDIQGNASDDLTVTGTFSNVVGSSTVTFDKTDNHSATCTVTMASGAKGLSNDCTITIHHKNGSTHCTGSTFKPDNRQLMAAGSSRFPWGSILSLEQMVGMRFGLIAPASDMQPIIASIPGGVDMTTGEDKFHIILPKIKTPLPADGSSVANRLWYLGGVVADGNNYQSSVKFEVVPNFHSSIRYTWEVTNGSDKASVDPTADTTKANINSRAASTSQDDVTVQLSCGSLVLDSVDFGIFSPDHRTVESIDESYYSHFYLILTVPVWFYDEYTRYHMTAIDNYNNDHGKTMYNKMDINEDFGSPTHLDPSETWSSATPVHGGLQLDTTTDWIDNYEISGNTYTISPSPVAYSDPAASTGVYKIDQKYYGGASTGGSGKLFQSHSLKYYRGYARQE